MKGLRYSLVSCILLLGLLISACGGAATEPPAPAAAPTDAPAQAADTPAPTGEVAEIGFFNPSYGPNFDGYLQGIVDSFNAAHEGEIHVSMSYVDEETYKTKLLVDLRSDNPPDVFFQWEGGKALSTINAGFAEPLDRYYEKYGWGDFLSPGAVSLAEVNGQKYFVGWNMAAMAVYYNKDLFAKHGVSVPTTYDEMMAAAETFKAAGVVPFMEANINKWPAQFPHENILVHKYGLEVWNQLANNEIPWTDERVVDSLAVYNDWAVKGYLHPDYNAMDITDAVIPWNDGEAAMWFQGNWMSKYFLEESGAFTDFFLFPAMDPAIGQIPQVFCDFTEMIHAKSPYKDQAAEFVDYLINAENQTKMMELGIGVATNMNADFAALSPLDARIFEAASASGKPSFMPVDHQFDPSISNEYLDVLQGMLIGMATPEEVAQTTEAAAVEFRGEVK